MIVMKFGGTSLGNAERIKTAADLIIGRAARRPLVVLSAVSGMTNQLLGAARAAWEGKVDVLPMVRRHREICEGLGIDKDLVTPLLLELKDLLKGISLVRELTPRSLDFAASFGERASTLMMAEYLRSVKGVKAKAWAAWDLGLTTDDRFTQATPLPTAEAEMAARLERLPVDEIPIVTGFIAKDKAGEITTIGRNGSDWSATIFGAAANAEEVEIWTDVDGVMTADPHVIKDARLLDVMTYAEAAELAYYGGKVLHPLTLAPAMRKNITVRVLNTLRPQSPGTKIVRELSDAHRSSLAGPVKSIVYRENQILLQIVSARMLMQHGYMAQVFGILDKYEVVINMITTSEVTLSLTTDKMAGVQEALKEICALGEATVTPNKTIVGVVGENIHSTRGIVAEVLATLSAADVNVDMVSVGASKVNITVLIDNADITKAVRALHTKFFATV